MHADDDYVDVVVGVVVIVVVVLAVGDYRWLKLFVLVGGCKWCCICL